MTLDGPPGRSLVVRMLLRFVHRRDARRRTHPALRWLLAQLGRDPARPGLATPCRQCGEPASVRVLRLSPRRARYWCARCGAVVTLASRAGVRLLAERPTVSAPASATRPSAESVDTRQVMPAAMRRWAESRSRRPVSVDSLDKPAMYQLYKRWDAYLAGLPPDAVAGLATDGQPTPRAGLPAISAVVGALHDRCYRTELVVEALLDPVPDADPGYRAALRERVEHARRWLATRADELCWILSRLPGGELAVPDQREVEAAVAAFRSGHQPDPVAGRAARAALFGTDGGPALPTLQAVYPATRMLAALEEYVNTGARPLRADVYAHLTAPEQPVP